MKTVFLYQIAHGRSGDKGDAVNVGIIARKPEFYEFIGQTLTPERVKSHMGQMVAGEVIRYDLPNLHAYNFILNNALGGGGTMSLQLDAQGKTYAAALLKMKVEVPEEWEVMPWPQKSAEKQ
ncbi:MAG: hypothetical protein D6675_01305 [Gemmatimonadetes bacterium]|nr:MAG: hypothetical protein D6675_01305 [Gemmatimonadota bacterium]